MRSAFESWPAGSPSSRSSSGVSYDDDDATKRVRTRVVGFPESPPNFKSEANELSRFASCTLDERPKRQSSLAQQLALEAFEQEQKPRLRAINTKTKNLNIRTRRASTPPAGGGHGQQQHSNRNITVQSGPDSDNNRISFEFPSTLPSGQGGTYMQHHTSNHHYNNHHHQLQLQRSGSEAMAIPQGLTKAYTAPQPLPELSELSPSLMAIIQGSSSGNPTAGTTATVTTPTRSTRNQGRVGSRLKPVTTSASRLLPSPASSQHSPPAPLPPHRASSSPFSAIAAISPQAAIERGALAQVAGLKEALRQQQEEVARLQLELAKLAMQQQSRQRSGSADVQMTPVTPDAADEQSGKRGGERHHSHEEGGKSMSLEEESAFEGFDATAGAPAASHHQYGGQYSTPYEGRGGRAWCG
jgi:hypothetical protein